MSLLFAAIAFVCFAGIFEVGLHLPMPRGVLNLPSLGELLRAYF